MRARKLKAFYGGIAFLVVCAAGFLIGCASGGTESRWQTQKCGSAVTAPSQEARLSASGRPLLHGTTPAARGSMRPGRTPRARGARP